MVTIQSVYCDPIPLPRLLYYNTMPAHCNTNHPTTHPRLQYKFSITIQLGSSPNQFSAPIFFFSFFIFFFPLFPATGKCPKKYIYTFFFSHTCYWKNTQKHKYNFFFHFFQLLEDTQKNIPIYYYYFFHFLEYSNKFIKIYFIQFSSILQLVKP